MAYNTFTNEVEKKIILIDIDTDTDADAGKQCIICLEKTSIDEKDTVTLINEMHFLIKNCDCLCYAHHKCLEKWISTNPVCPICKREISFPVILTTNKEVRIHIQGIQSNGIQGNGIQGNGIQGNGIQSNSIIQTNNNMDNNMSSSHFCIRMTVLVFFILTVLQIIFRN